MAALSPRPSMPAPSLSNPDISTPRPNLMKRQSSQSSHGSKHAAFSPASTGEWEYTTPPRHHVKPARKTKIVLPRNHGSARNLAKLAQQVQQQQQQQQQHSHHNASEESRRNSRHRSKDSDTEIRLPRSFQEQKSHPPLRRNFTATQLPRNTSHTKLKKNLSHGQLTRLALNTTNPKAPSPPGAKARSKRPKSADMIGLEKDLHEQEVELAQGGPDSKEPPKKVGFAVGSSDGTSDAEDLPQMEGQGLQEDEWTDQSASASPYSTRQSSRRASMVFEKPADKRAVPDTTASKDHAVEEEQTTQQQVPTGPDGTSAQIHASRNSDDAEEPASPRTLPHKGKRAETKANEPQEQPSAVKSPRRSVSHGSKEHTNPATRHLLTRNSQNPAPALVSNISALDSARSGRESPAPSMTSSRSHPGAESAADPAEEELVSRFMPSESHPSGGSGMNTTSTTPKTGSLHTPEDGSFGGETDRERRSPAFGVGPVSPDSARSLSSSVQTPGPFRSRHEERMMNEKAIAEMEDAAAHGPIIPPHVFDRRNESLKSYLNLASLGGDGRGGLSTTTGLSIGPEIFQGRFKAVNTELKVVQRFRDPTAESIARLHACKAADFAKLRSPKASPPKQAAAKLQISKSATALPKQASKLSTSTSPPESPSPGKPSISSARSTTNIKRSDSRRSKVTFSQASSSTRETVRDDEGKNADAIARQLWEKIAA